MKRHGLMTMLASVVAALAAVPAFGVAGGGADTTAASGSLTEALFFYVAGGLAAAFALGCVLSANIVRMATCLFGVLGSVAVLYFLMSANFVGAIQLIVYAAGTLVVIIFGVMLTSRSPFVRFAARKWELAAGAAVLAVLFGCLVAALRGLDGGGAGWRAEPRSAAEIGEALLTTYLVPFELASVLLLAVMIGSAFLARPEKRA